MILVISKIKKIPNYINRKKSVFQSMISLTQNNYILKIYIVYIQNIKIKVLMHLV